MTTPTLLRSGVVLGWIVLAGFACLLVVMVAQVAHAMGFALPSLQSPAAAGHQLGQSLASRLGGGG